MILLFSERYRFYENLLKIVGWKVSYITCIEYYETDKMDICTFILFTCIKIIKFIIELDGIVPSDTETRGRSLSHVFQPQYPKSTSTSNSRSSSINRKVRLTKTRGRPRPRSLIGSVNELNLRSFSPSKIPVTKRISLSLLT